MPTYRSRWKARVEQDIEVEADNVDEARERMESEMDPRRVVELIDFELDEIEEVKPDAADYV